MRIQVTDRLIRHVRTWDPNGNMAELARRAGCSPHVLWRLCRGNAQWLSDKNTAALARGLGVSENELLRIAVGASAADPGATPPARGSACRHRHAQRLDDLLDIVSDTPALRAEIEAELEALHDQMLRKLAMAKAKKGA